MRWSAAVAGVLLAWLAAAPAYAQTGLAAAVTDDVISVTSDFRGARVTVFGALPDRRGRGDVIIAVRGPAENPVVLRKRRVLGLWIAGAPVRFVGIPSYYALVSNRAVGEIANAASRQRLGLEVVAAAQIDGPLPARIDDAAYRAALKRLKQGAGLYQESQAPLKRLPGGLFKAAIQLPANAPVGAYTADVYFFRSGRLVDSEKAAVLVSTAGFERFVKRMAQEQPFLYGLTTIALALSAGWLASFLFRRT